MNWTDERVETLKKLWAGGLSASQIAAQLGGVSRNAVIGKVHRLKLSNRGRTSAAPPHPKRTSQGGGGGRSRQSRPVTATVGATALKAQFETEVVAEQRLRPVENVVVPISRKLTLTELTENTCKWPNGDPLSQDFSFCGNDTGEDGPYCSYHSRLAYQPSGERRGNR